MPVPADYILAFLVVVVASIYENVYFWPHFRAAIAAGHPDARWRGYRGLVFGEWLFALAALVIWTLYARPWRVLGFELSSGWRLAFGASVVLLAAGLVMLQRWSVVRLPAERRVAARPKLGNVAFMLPRTAREARWFVAVSLTAGFCEELLFRGYLPWLFAPWVGQIGGMAVAVAAFGIGHAYQGRRGAIRVTITGAVMAAIVMIGDSLIPAMIVHALIDIGGGTVGYLLLRDPGMQPAVPVAKSPMN